MADELAALVAELDNRIRVSVEKGRGVVLLSAAKLSALLSALETAQRERDEAYANGKADGANEERSVNWIRESRGYQARIAELEREVAALRECERALRDLEASGTRVLDVNHHARQSGWTAVQDLAESLVRSRAALASVRKEGESNEG